MLIKLLKCISKSVSDMIYHDGIEHAGYLSFLVMLSIFPFLFFFMAIIGAIGDETLANKLVEIIMATPWAKFIDALKPRILELMTTPPQSLLTIAIISAIWTASSIFEALRTVLNRAYRVTSAPSYIFRRMLSILEFLVAVILAVVLLSTLLVIPHIIYFYEKFVSSYIPFNLNLFITPETDKIRFFISMIVMVFSIAFTYYALPNRKNEFWKTLPGSLLVVFGWYAFSLLFKYYVNNVPQVNLIYGSIAGIIIALLYFYFCSIILIIGAEFNYQVESNFYNKEKK